MVEDVALGRDDRRLAPGEPMLDLLTGRHAPLARVRPANQWSACHTGPREALELEGLGERAPNCVLPVRELHAARLVTIAPYGWSPRG